MAERHWVGFTDNWNGTAGAKWSTTPGGVGGAAVPTSSDDVFLDSSSGTVTVTITASANCKSLNCTGFTGTLAGSSNLTVRGDITLGSGMTMSHSGFLFIFASSTITCNGKSFANSSIECTAGGGTFTLGDNFASTGDINFADGTFNFNNKDATLANFGIGSAEAGAARVVSPGSGTITVTGTIFGYNQDDVTYSASTGTIKFTNTSSSTVTCYPRISAAHGGTFNNLWFARGASTGINLINTVGVAFPTPDYTVGPTFAEVKDTGTAAHALATPDDNTVYVTTFTVNGSAGNIISLGAQTPGNTHSSLSKSSGTVICDRLTITDSQALGGASWIATNSTDGGDNTGWVFGIPSSAATFAGASTLRATATLALQARETLAGAGSLSAAASVLKFGTAVFGGAGSLSITATLQLSALATFAGAGSMSAVGNLAKDIQFPGEGSLSVSMTAHLAASATFPGAGNLSALVALRMQARATLPGAGSMAAIAVLLAREFAAFAGIGTLSAATIQAGFSEIVLPGAGGMSVETSVFVPSSAAFGGLGHFCINATVRPGAFGATTNRILTGPGPGNNLVV